MSSTELEQIQKKKSELANELRSMEQREKALAEGIKILEEKFAIQELEEQVKAKRAALDRLESKRKELEKRIKEPQKNPQPLPKPSTPGPHVPKGPEKKEPMEVKVSAAPAGNQQPKQSAAPAGNKQPKKPEEQKEKEKEEEKKKRRWF